MKLPFNQERFNSVLTGFSPNLWNTDSVPRKFVEAAEYKVSPFEWRGKSFSFLESHLMPDYYSSKEEEYIQLLTIHKGRKALVGVKRNFPPTCLCFSFQGESSVC